jgi:hypothetical protein
MSHPQGAEDLFQGFSSRHAVVIESIAHSQGQRTTSPVHFDSPLSSITHHFSSDTVQYPCEAVRHGKGDQRNVGAFSHPPRICCNLAEVSCSSAHLAIAGLAFRSPTSRQSHFDGAFHWRVFPVVSVDQQGFGRE